MECSPSMNAFFERLPVSSEAVLLLDYDGTVAPFRTERDQAKPYKSVLQALRRLQDRTDTRLIFVSGRSADDLSRLLKPTGLDCELWGSHGQERRSGNKAVRPKVSADEALPIAIVHELLCGEGLIDRIESKPFSIAVHWRGLSDERAHAVESTTRDVFSHVMPDSRLRVLEFDGGLELNQSRWNKGNAVRTILTETGTDAAVAYLGDDVTDEDAFEAIRPVGLGVLVRPDYRKTKATGWLRPPAELVKFLDRWTGLCGGAA